MAQDVRPGNSSSNWGRLMRVGKVLCFRGGGHVFDIASSIAEAATIIEPLARANRGEKFYAATIVLSIHEPLPPLAIELATDGISDSVGVTDDLTSAKIQNQYLGQLPREQFNPEK